jgi:hypothetical protein
MFPVPADLVAFSGSFRIGHALSDTRCYPSSVGQTDISMDMVLVDGKLFCYTKDPQFRAGVAVCSQRHIFGKTDDHKITDSFHLSFTYHYIRTYHTRTHRGVEVQIHKPFTCSSNEIPHRAAGPVYRTLALRLALNVRKIQKGQ